MTESASALPGSLVSPDWLARHLDDVVVVDVRWYMDGRSGHDEYANGHIPGAVWADLDRDLSAPAAPVGEIGGRHPLPAPEDFAASMGRLGISDGTLVVAYDDIGGSRAARLWWMLTVLGESAAVLDGGIGAWTGGLTTSTSTYAPGMFSARPWPADRIVTGDEVAERIDRPGVIMLDARSASRFRGEENPIDNRFGHIPGARSAPWDDNIDPERGSMQTAPKLAERFRELGAHDADEVIASCGSGVTACHNALALDQLGIPARIYVGSWSEWGGDTERPVEVGD